MQKTQDQIFWIDNENFNQAPMFDIRLGRQDFTFTLIRSSFVNCSISRQGSTVSVYSQRTKTLNIYSSYFEGNAAIEGGAIYCKDCYFSLLNTTFKTNVAKFGGDFMLLDPLITIQTYESITTTGSLATQNGGSILIKDTSSIDYNVKIFQGRGLNSSFSNCYAKNDGGCIYMEIRGNLIMKITDTYFENMGAEYNGGMLMVPQLTGSNQWINLNIQNCVFDQAFTIHENGGVIFINENARQLTLTIEDTQLRKLYAQLNGGFLYSGARNQLIATFNNVTIDDIQAENGGFIYSLTDSNQMNVQSNSVISNAKALQSGGLFYIENENANIRINIVGSTILNSQATDGYGGLIYANCEQIRVDFTVYTNISSTKSRKGGIIFSNARINTLYIWQTQLDNSEAIEDAAGFYLNSSYQTWVYVDKNSTLKNFGSGSTGGVFYVSGDYISMNINNLQSLNTSATDQGGFLVTSEDFDRLVIRIKYSQFLNTSAEFFGSFISVRGDDFPDVDIQISDSNFTCKESTYYDDWPSTYIMTLKSLDEGQGLIAGLLSFGEFVTGDVSSTKNKYQKCYATYEGSIFNVPKFMTLTDTQSKYEFNGGLNGLISAVSSRVVMNDAYIKDSIAKYSGFVHMVNNASVAVNRLKISYSKSRLQGSAFYIEGKGQTELKILNCPDKLEYFESSQDGGFLYNSNPDLDLNISNCIINHVYSASDGGLLYFDKGDNIKLYNVSITNITSFGNGGLIYSLYYGTKFNLGRVLVKCKEFYDAVDLNQELYKNQTSQGSMIYVKNSPSFYGADNSFQNCFISSEGSVYNLENSTLDDRRSSYIQNSAIKGGVFYFNNVNSTFQSINVERVLAYLGGTFFILGRNILTIQGIYVNQSESFGDGGFLQLREEVNRNEISIYSDVTNKVRIYNLASREANGGAFFIDCSNTDISFNNVLFQNTSSLISGGFANIKKAKNIFISKSTIFQANSRESGSVIYSESVGSNFDLQETTFDCQGEMFGNINNYLIERIKTNGGAFYLKSALTTNSYGNTYQNCYVGDVGGIFYFTNTNFQETNSVYQNNAAIYGGVYYCINCNIYLRNTQVINNKATKGGLVYLQDNGDLTFDNFMARGSYSMEGGGLVYLTQKQSNSNSTITFKNTATMSDFASEQSGGGFYIDHKGLNFYVLNPISMQNSNAHSGHGGFLYIVNGNNFLIQNSNFIGFGATGNGSFIYSTSYELNLTLLNNILKGSSTEWTTYYLDDLNKTTKGGAVYVEDSKYLIRSTSNKFSNLYISHQGGAYALINTSINDSFSSYQYTKARFGGAIYCELCHLELFQAKFDHNQGLRGGSIYINNHQGKFTATEISFANQYSQVSGGVMYLQGISTGSIEFRNISIKVSESIQTGGSFYLDHQNSIFNINNMTLNQSKAEKEGGVFYINNQTLLNITNSQFHNLTSHQKGSFMFSTSQLLTLNTINSTFTCSNKSLNYSQDLEGNIDTINPYLTNAGSFYIDSALGVKTQNISVKNCYLGETGGAFSLINTTLIDNNSSYSSNAALLGGVIYSETSTITLLNANVSNSYGINGGVIYLHKVNPISINNSRFINNSATMNGGFTYITESGVQTGFYNYTMNFTNITNSKSGQSGGAFFVESTTLRNISMYRVNIIKSMTANTGGVIHIKEMKGHLNISSDINTQNLISDFNASSMGSFLYSAGQQDFSLNIYNSIVEARNYYDYPSIQSKILDTSSGFAGAFYISQSKIGIISRNNTFRQCYTAMTGGVFTLVQTRLDDHNSKYYQNAAITGGAFKCETCSIIMIKSSIFQNFAANGAVFLIDNYASLMIADTEINSNQAASRGGVFSIIKSDFGSLEGVQLQIENCSSIQYNKANEGGFINVENEYMSINITNSKIQFQTAALRGGIINSIKAKSISILNSTLTNFQSIDGAGIYSISEDVTIHISKSFVECNQLFDFTTVSKYLNAQEYTFTLQSNFFVLRAKQVISETNKFQSCAVCNLGGVFTLQQTVFNDTKSRFIQNAGASGGVFLITQSNVSLIGSYVESNYAYEGGAMSAYQDSFIYMHSCQFTSNTAYSSGGVMYVNTESFFWTINSLFQKNYAPESSVILVLGGSMVQNNTIINSNIINNNASTNTLSLMYGNLIITSSAFESNYALFRSKNIFLGFCKVQVSNSKFTSNTDSDDPKSILNEQTTGTFFFIIFDVNIMIQGCTFQNGRSRLGGAIYISGDSYIKIYSSKFISNYAATYGGAIYAVGFKNLEIGENSFLRNNLAVEKGDDFYVSNTQSNFTLSKVNITNPNAKGSIYAEQVALTISESGFQNIQNQESAQGGALYCLNCRKINITQSSFINILSKQGGALYIQENEVNKKLSDKLGKYQILDSIFQGCEAQQTGGAIFLDNIQYMTIESTKFQENKVKYSKDASNMEVSGSGGAVYYTCNSQLLNCKFEIIRKSIFSKNSAEIKGGAIFWDTLEPIYLDSDIIFRDNSAKFYGNDVACFSQTLNVISQSQYKQLLVKVGLAQDDRLLRQLEIIQSKLKPERLLDGIVNINEGKVQSQRSGGSIPTIYLAHVDKYGQIVGSDFSSKVRVSVDSTSNTNPKALAYPPNIEGQTQFDSQAGMAVIQGISFAGTPGYTYSLSFSTDGIDLTKESNKNYMKNQGAKTNLDTELPIALRDCEIGEQYTSSGKCMSCPDGQSFALVKMTSPGDCSTCPTDKAVCNGGSNVGPKNGYYRKNNQTSTFVKCLYAPACLGMIPPVNDPMGTCAEGYQNVICADCQINYSRTGDFECSKCPDPIQNVIRLFFIMIGLSALVVFTVRSTLQGAKEKNNVTSIFMKILLNHIQLILLTASFDFKWPDEVLELFDTAKPVAAISTQIISFDCFLDQRNEEQQSESQTNAENGQIRIFFQKLIFLAILPLVLAAITIGIWQIIRLIKKNNVEIQGRTISTMVIVLFLIHPNIVQFMFYNFKCIEIDSDLRVLNDLEVLCWNNQHKIFSFFVAAPSIIVWGIGIPAFALLIMKKFSFQLEQLEIREKFGFLYRGYRHDFYFWEIVIMYRKMLLIFIAVFIGNIGVIAQALIVFKKPYSTDALNDLETMSLVTSMISVYCGLFFIANKPEEWIKDNPEYSTGSLSLSSNSLLFFFAMIVMCNLLFLLYWCVKMYYEVKAKFRSIVPRVYLILCLCFNREKLQRELKEYEIKLINENLKEDFLKNLSVIKNMYKKGEIVLNQNNLERLLSYLHPDKVKEIAIKQQEVEIDVEAVEKEQKRKDRAKENVSKMKQAQVINNTDKLFQFSAEDVKRSDSVRTNVTLEKKSIDFDEAFLDEEENKKPLMSGAETQDSVIVKRSFKSNHIEDNDHSDFQDSKGSQSNTTYNMQDLYLSTNRELLLDTEDEQDDNASIQFSEKEQYDKELQVLKDIQKLDEYAKEKQKMENSDKVSGRKSNMKVRGQNKKQKETLIDKIKQALKNQSQKKEMDGVKKDSILRPIEIEDITMDEQEILEESFESVNAKTFYSISNVDESKKSKIYQSNNLQDLFQKNQNLSKFKILSQAKRKKGFQQESLKDKLDIERDNYIEVQISKASQKNKQSQQRKTMQNQDSQVISEFLNNQNIEAILFTDSVDSKNDGTKTTLQSKNFQIEEIKENDSRELSEYEVQIQNLDQENNYVIKNAEIISDLDDYSLEGSVIQKYNLSLSEGNQNEDQIVDNLRIPKPDNQQKRSNYTSQSNNAYSKISFD
ncbi:UNKNOWN [Stylonychia lemnae]|uniref:Uncharacterized protein n=1 Tax=Stylonychia lemnae TaxID=5949 RepID=A0A078AZI8_STYLE|nr:UNKNOWN [Stylonychia lemnae]|eukprot:CDW87526.1 UNKNOWN [Stylonychia lemnae]